MRVTQISGQADLKLNIKKTKILVTAPITLWYVDGEEIEVVSDFAYLCSENSA